VRSTSRDDAFFIDAVVTGFSEDHLRVKGNSDSNDNRSAIEDAVLNLTGDDNTGAYHVGGSHAFCNTWCWRGWTTELGWPFPQT
jgi:hypothetical protein